MKIWKTPLFQVTGSRDFPAENSGHTTGDNDLLEETIESSDRLTEGMEFPAEKNGLTPGDNDSLDETIDSD